MSARSGSRLSPRFSSDGSLALNAFQSDGSVDLYQQGAQHHHQTTNTTCFRLVRRHSPARSAERSSHSDHLDLSRIRNAVAQAVRVCLDPRPRCDPLWLKRIPPKSGAFDGGRKPNTRGPLRDRRPRPFARCGLRWWLRSNVSRILRAVGIGLRQELRGFLWLARHSITAHSANRAFHSFLR